MDKTPGVSHLATTMAAVCAVGGLAGFAMKKSVPSLVGGLVTGAAFGASAYLISQGGDKTRTGFGVATATSVALSVGMVPRFRKTGKVMPAGALIGLGAISALYHAYKFNEWS